jgi:hypothetical protein
MTAHEQRLKVLADALLIADTNSVIARLRSRDVMCFGAGDALLFATGPDWSDERLVEAAFDLFVHDELRSPRRDGESRA